MPRMESGNITQGFGRTSLLVLGRGAQDAGQSAPGAQCQRSLTAPFRHNHDIRATRAAPCEIDAAVENPQRGCDARVEWVARQLELSQGLDDGVPGVSASAATPRGRGRGKGKIPLMAGFPAVGECPTSVTRLRGSQFLRGIAKGWSHHLATHGWGLI